LVTPPAMAEKVAEALDHYLFSEKVVIRDASPETALFVLAGPESRSTVERLAGASPPEKAWSHVAARLGETPVRLVSGGGETGEAEVWIMCLLSDAAKASEALRGAGVGLIGPEAFETLRIEAGTPLFGRDIDDTVLLPEIPFESLLSHTKGCYPGQEVVVRIRDRGHVNRMLRGLVLEGREVPPAGAELVADDAAVGKVTSAVWSLGLEQAIGPGVRPPPVRGAGHSGDGSPRRTRARGERQRPAVHSLIGDSTWRKTGSRARPAPICSSTPTTPSTGIPGATRHSQRRGPR